VFKFSQPTAFDKLLKFSNVENLIQERQYDSALVILDSAMRQREVYERDWDKLIAMRNSVLKSKYEKEKAADNIFAECVALMKEFRFDEAFAKSEQATAADAVHANDKQFFEQFKADITAARDSFAQNKTFKMPFSHRVKSGETLGNIAARYGMKVSDIKKLNHLSADWIKEGQNIVVWTSAESQIHTVGQGESITAIARKYGMSIKNFKYINQLENDIIKAGQKVKVVMVHEPRTQKEQ
jgi:LysM repeat protein